MDVPSFSRDMRQKDALSSLAKPDARWYSPAFTLVELLVVMAIILILAALIVPALKGTLEGINLSGTAESIVSQLTLARQTAMSRNTAVEVRLYQQTNNAPPWNLMAVVIPKDFSGAALDEWINISGVFPGNVIVDPGQSSVAPDSGNSTHGKYFSTILDTGGRKYDPANIPTAPWSYTELTSAPSAVKSRGYVAFRFLPDGSTNLPPFDQGSSPPSSSPLSWCLTLKTTSALATKDGTTPAANFVSLVIDPQTGRVLPYRP